MDSAATKHHPQSAPAERQPATALLAVPTAANTTTTSVSASSVRRPSTFVADAAADAGFLQRSTSAVSQRMRSLRDNITVEPLLAFYIVPCVFVGLAVQNLNLEKACRVNLGYAPHVCDALTQRNTANYSVEEQEVQRLVAGMTSWKTILQSGLPGLMILFWGSWSDRHRRRKPCMLFPIVGELVTATVLMLCVYCERVPMEVVGVAETIFGGLSGGWYNMMLGVFSYVADVTTEEERTFRIGVVNLFVTLGIPVGMAFSGVLLQQIGFYGVFALASLCHICTLMYGIFGVREPSTFVDQAAAMTTTGLADKVDKPPNTSCSLIADFFDKTHVVGTFRVVFKDGPKKRRIRVITLIVALMVIVGPMYGEMAVMYLFTRYRFNWSEVDFSVFSTYTMMTSLFGTMFSMAVFSQKLKIDDSMVAFISSMSKILASLVYAFSQTTWHLYMGPIVELFSGTSFIAVRSIASKLVNSDELGKVNSLLSVAESMMPLLYTPLYAQVYAHTMNTLPGAFFLMGGALTLPAMVIYVWMYYIQKRVGQEALDSVADAATVELSQLPATEDVAAGVAPELEALLPNGTTSAVTVVTERRANV